MKATEYIEIMKTGKRPIVRFTNKTEDIEADVDEGMLARAISATNEGDGTTKVVFEVKEFESINIPLMKPNYYDKDGKPTLRWIDTNFYPKNGLEFFYIETDGEIPFELIDNNVAFEDYLNSGTNLGYTQWLEEQYIAMKR